MVEAVVEVLLDAANQHLHVRCTEESSDAFAKSSVLAAVFERHHQAVVGLKRVERRGVNGIQIARVDERGVDALSASKRTTFSPF